MNKSMIAIASVLIALVLMVSVAKADGFGEYSGFLVYNISINTSHTEAWTLINSYNYSLQFRIVPPNITINASNVTPEINFSVLNGTIAPNSDYQINVTVFIPVGVPTNSFYQGYATAFATSNNQNNASARIEIGTAKLIQITAEPQIIKKKKTTTSTTLNSTSTTIPASALAAAEASNNNSGIGESTLIIVVLVVALVAVLAYVLGSRGKNSDKKK